MRGIAALSDTSELAELRGCRVILHTDLNDEIVVDCCSLTLYDVRMVVLALILASVSPMAAEQDDLTNAVIDYWRCGQQQLRLQANVARKEAVDRAVANCADQENKIALAYRQATLDFPEQGPSETEVSIQKFIAKRREELRFKLDALIASQSSGQLEKE